MSAIQRTHSGEIIYHENEPKDFSNHNIPPIPTPSSASNKKLPKVSPYQIENQLSNLLTVVLRPTKRKADQMEVEELELSTKKLKLNETRSFKIDRDPLSTHPNFEDYFDQLATSGSEAEKIVNQEYEERSVSTEEEADEITGFLGMDDISLKNKDKFRQGITTDLNSTMDPLPEQRDS